MLTLNKVLILDLGILSENNLDEAIRLSASLQHNVSAISFLDSAESLAARHSLVNYVNSLVGSGAKTFVRIPRMRTLEVSDRILALNEAKVSFISIVNTEVSLLMDLPYLTESPIYIDCVQELAEAATLSSPIYTAELAQNIGGGLIVNLSMAKLIRSQLMFKSLPLVVFGDTKEIAESNLNVFDEFTHILIKGYSFSSNASLLARRIPA